jgi:hypothetical protein
MPDLSIWTAWIVGIAIALGLIGLTWHALFGDKPKGRRCPRCDHDLAATTSLTCSECGYTAPDEATFHRTRRHWRRALLWLALLVFGAAFVRLRATEDRLISLLPNSVVIALLPYVPPSQGPLADVQAELIDRIVGGSLDREALDAVIDRLVTGDSDAAPASPEWQARYSRLALQVLAVAAQLAPDSPEAQAAQRMRQLPADTTLRVGRAFTKSSPIPADLHLLDWWPFNTRAEVTVTDTATGESTRWLYDASARRRPISMQLAPAKDGETERTVEVTFRTRPTDSAGEPVGDWSAPTTMTAKAAIQPPIERSLEPVSSPELDAAIAATLARGVVRWEGGDWPVAFRLDLQATNDVSFDGVLFGVAIDLLEGDVSRRTLHAWWPGGPRGGGWRAEVVREDIEALRRLPADGAGWSVRVRGVEDIAGRAFVPAQTDLSAAATESPMKYRWWSGERVFPADVVQGNGASPRRTWRRQ